MENYMEDYDFDDMDFELMEEQTELKSQETIGKTDTFGLDDVIDRDLTEIQNPKVIKEHIYMNENTIPAFKIQEQNSGEPFVVMGFKGGKFEYGMQGIKKIPYNVPDLITATNRVVFITNGEDKADFLKSLGFITTTAPFNVAKKWKEDYNKYLQTAGKALIVQDNSEKGKLFAENTYATIGKALGNNVGIVNLKKLASKFNIDLEDNTSLMKFREILADDSLIKVAFEALEKTMLVEV